MWSPLCDLRHANSEGHEVCEEGSRREGGSTSDEVRQEQGKLISQMLGWNTENGKKKVLYYIAVCLVCWRELQKPSKKQDVL